MRPGSRGFSLLEAIVALVILSTTAIALFSLQQANMFTLQRAEAHARENEITRSVLSVVQTINPMEKASGERPFGNLVIRWKATLLQPIKPGVTGVGLPGYFDLGLYQMTVEVRDSRRVVLKLSARQVGFKQTRFPQSDDQ